MSYSPLLSLLFLLSLSVPLSVSLSSKSYVFKGCSTQKLTSTVSLISLLSSLAAQSYDAKFRSNVAGDVSGLFQCRADLSQPDCSNCVRKIAKSALGLCSGSVAGRVQLVGCYIRYQSSGFGEIPGTQFLYKVCGSGQTGGSDFRTLLGSALGEIVTGVNGTGYYTGDYESVYVLGQCEGDLGNGDCVDCVKSAVDRAVSDCGSSVPGQIYLQKCYISYNYRNGVTAEPGSSGGRGKNTQKTIATVVGAVAAFGLLVAALLFLKSAFKKKSSKYGGLAY